MIPLPSSPRILVTRADRIGDLVLSTPVFEALRKKFTDARIIGLTFCENRDLVEGNPQLDEIILYDKLGSEKGIVGNCRFAFKLAALKFDMVIHLHATNRMHWITWLAGIPVRIGYHRKCPWLLSHRIRDRKHEGTKHEAEYNFDLIAPLDVPVPEKIRPYFPLQERAARSLEELVIRLRIPVNRPWVVFNPSASCPSKMWPAARFGEIAGRIYEKYGAACLFIGTSEDPGLLKPIQRNIKGPLYDLTGRLSIGMLGALLAKARLLISNDSGPVHIANAVGTPVISIFGRNQPGLSPKRWGPLGTDSMVVWRDVGCEECLAHQCQIHFLCLDVISVDEVMECVNRFGNRLTPLDSAVQTVIR